MDTINAYDFLALHYNDWQQDFDEDKRTRYLKRLINKHSTSCFRQKKTSEQLLCDLGCGTGKTIVSFAADGYSAVGIDISELMLNIAAETADCMNVSVVFSRQDICSFSLPEPAAIIFCLMDTVNHLTAEKNLLRFFRRVNREMLPGGLFIFDFVTPFYFQNILSDEVFYFADEEKALFWQNHYNEKKKMNSADITMFVQNESGFYLRSEVEIRERSYSLEEIKKVLSECRFEICNIYGDLSMKAPKDDEQRVFIAAKKI